MPLPQKQYYTEEDYYNTSEDEHVELIDGQFYAQALPNRIHQEILMSVSKSIANYIDIKDGSCKVYPAPFAVKLFSDKKTIVEPDISVICDPDKLTDKGCSGPPDWIIEIISPSTAGHDYIRKLNLYKTAGVREYWIIDPREGAILVYYFQDDIPNYSTYTFEDKIKVKIYDDFYIDFKKIRL